MKAEAARPARKSKGSGSGGARNTGKKLPTNTSGLAGIWFQQRLGIGASPVMHTYICCAYTVGEGAEKKSKRTAFSIRTNGAETALMKAIVVRADAGLEAPSMREALAALEAYMKQAEAKAKPAGKSPGKARPKAKPKEKPT